MFGRFSLGAIGLTVGLSLTTMGIIAYIADNATLNLAGFFYGIPLILGGLALKVGELKPIAFSQETSSEVLALREAQATVTQNKIRTDVTRFIYGQDAHFDETLQKLGLKPNKESLPVLQSIRETAIDGFYTLILNFDSPKVSLEMWQSKLEKMEKYFGPNIRIDISQPSPDKIEVAFIRV